MRKTLSMTLLVCALSACQSDTDSTKIIVTVKSDLAVPGEMDSIRFDLTSEGRKVSPTTFQVTATGESSKSTLPVRMAFIPAKAKDASFSVTAVALKGPVEVVFQQATSRFTPGKVGYIELSLNRVCISTLCPGQTCMDGRCVDPSTIASTTTPLDGGVAPEVGRLSDASSTGDTPVAVTDDGGVVVGADGSADLAATLPKDTGPLPTDTGVDPDSGIALPIDTGAMVVDGSLDSNLPTDTAVVVPPDTGVVLSPDTGVVLSPDTGLSTDTPVPDSDAALPAVDASGCVPALTLTARGGNGVATLQWTGPSASTYRIWRGSSATGTLSPIGSSAATGFTDTSGLANGTSVFYQVSLGTAAPSCDSASNVAEAIPCAPPTVSTSIYGNDVTVTWTNTLAPQYTVSYGASETALSTTITTGANSYVIAGLPKDQPVYIKVSSNNPTCSTGDSPIMSATPTGCIAWPSRPVATAEADFQRNRVTWPDATGGTGALTYSVSSATAAAGPFTVLSAAAVSGIGHEDLANGTPYYYTVTAADSLGCLSPPSEVVTATPSLADCKALLCEDFETSTRDGWVSGNFQVRSIDGSNALVKFPATVGSIDFARSPLPLTSTLDYSIEARVKVELDRPTDQVGGGLVAMYDPMVSGSGLFLNLWGDSAFRLSGRGCASEFIMPASPDRVWHRVKLSVKGNQAEGYLDDMTTPKLVCASLSRTSGDLGVVSRLAPTRVNYDDIRITSP